MLWEVGTAWHANCAGPGGNVPTLPPWLAVKVKVSQQHTRVTNGVLMFNINSTDLEKWSYCYIKVLFLALILSWLPCDMCHWWPSPHPSLPLSLSPALIPLPWRSLELEALNFLWEWEKGITINSPQLLGEIGTGNVSTQGQPACMGGDDTVTCKYTRRLDAYIQYSVLNFKEDR